MVSPGVVMINSLTLGRVSFTSFIGVGVIVTPSSFCSEGNVLEGLMEGLTVKVVSFTLLTGEIVGDASLILTSMGFKTAGSVGDDVNVIVSAF